MVKRLREQASKLMVDINQFLVNNTRISELQEFTDIKPEFEKSGKLIPTKNPKIEFCNVSFKYPNDHNIVFSNLNLSIKQGEKIAIIGPSGGGKTTLCNLIPRFYDVCAGEIILDGKNIKDYTLKSLRGAIGVVQQEVYLFSGTVMENILYGRPDATRASNPERR